MVYMMAVSAKTARKGQEAGDIIGVYDYSNGPTKTEQELFEIIPVKKVGKTEIDKDFQKQLDPEKRYPKFPFSIKKISASEKAKLDNGSTPVAEIRTIIKKITPKKPVAAVAGA
jgi:signal recognition particle subunit SEC65